MPSEVSSPGRVGREQRREERRERVIAAAMRMARDGGYEAVQMRAVAEEADVALGTIYRYFRSKDEVLIAGLAVWIAALRRQLAVEAPPHDTAGERLRSVLDRAAASTEGSPVLMHALVTALSTTNPEAGEVKLAVDREFRALIESAIGDSPDVDVDGVVRVMGHVWYSALTRWVGGLAADGSVVDELHHASRLLLGTAEAV